MKILFQLLFAAILFASLYLSLTPIANAVPAVLNDKLVHMVSYFILILTFDFSVKSGEAIFVKAIFVFVYSCAIEYAQGFVPGREVSFWDIVANAVGIFSFVLCVPLLKRINAYKTLRIT